jgi:alpha-D-ribose 1-methylphosphonate 5-triphosphate diphosphatase
VRTILTGGTLVLPAEVLDGSLVAEDGHIVEVSARGYPAAAGKQESVLDVRGQLVLPGLVDLHNDAIETEINPRPGANLPLPFALSVLDRRLAAAGVTTEFDAVFFADMVRNERSLAEAPSRAEEILQFGESDRSLVHHGVLFRIDLWSPESLERALPLCLAAPVSLLTLNDHTPGQGQYNDVEQFKRYFREHLGRSHNEVEELAAFQMERAEQRRDVYDRVLKRVREAAATSDLVVMSHDDDTPERVDLMYHTGARVAEFPVTLEAAMRQRELGMMITAGAPNVVRGGSATGNIAALTLLEHGLLDILCADYHAPSLLAAAFRVAKSGLLSLAEAVRLVSLNPARAARIDARVGSLEVGKQADVIVLGTGGAVPAVELALRAGVLTYYARDGGAGELSALAFGQMAAAG